MVSSSGGSTESSSPLTNSGSDENLQALMNQKRNKRMLSNRESARRSRMRKQEHLDNLRAQLNQLRNDNFQIRTILDISTHQYFDVETQNYVLRTQATELSSRLNSLADILQFMNLNGGGGGDVEPPAMAYSDCFAYPWSSFIMNQLPIMASPNMLQHH
ncbi:Light-inducible protein CPRF2 [Platanthera guangdongensis]|uniref:Light-inducible protein CPRF2 n=1 Tax=Platanthera guangdongensis TaxID=2320717 RepID=A0ABR2M4U5_9ASPA